MPLLPGKKQVGHNIAEMEASGHDRAQSIAAALNVARTHKAEGGSSVHVKKITAPHAEKVKHFSGPIHSSVAGRTDHLPMTVHSGSYVLPADVISGAPGAEGNTMAGFAHAKRVFGGMPRGQGAQPYGHTGGPYGMAKGGSADDKGGCQIVAAGGEYVIHPDTVREIGGGDIDLGHRVLDEFVKRVRADNIKTLKNLPGPKRD
jgi:hypothetical protein